MNKQQIEMLNRMITDKVNDKIFKLPITREYSPEEKRALLEDKAYDIIIGKDPYDRDYILWKGQKERAKEYDFLVNKIKKEAESLRAEILFINDDYKIFEQVKNW
jgi:hypothetical protein